MSEASVQRSMHEAGAPPPQRPPRSDGWWAALGALVVRLVVVAWAAGRFPPAEDGHFYDVVAGRIAQGLGYTWAWPDGAVTYAAHYPVGYPALLGGLYALVGPRPVAAMVLAAVFGALSVLAVHRIAARELRRRGALIAAVLVALHPALVMYTPALMTEGIVASSLALVGWLVVAVRDRGASLRGLAALGLVLGGCALLRPQTLLLAPVFGALAALPAATTRKVLGSAAVVTTLAIGVCLPWTARNCVRMDACTFVSANAGWNLLIGSSHVGEGGWAPIERVGVPEACREVFGEAGKDHCFRRAALHRILSDPGAWLALASAKLAVTFDYGGAPGWYLHASSPNHFDNRAKLALGAIETLYHRLVLACGVLALARRGGARSRVRRALGVVTVGFLLVRSAWVAHVGLCLLAALQGPRALGRHLGMTLAVSVVAVTALTHAVFFGAGRYALVGYPLLCVLAALAFDTPVAAGDTSGRGT